MDEDEEEEEVGHAEMVAPPAYREDDDLILQNLLQTTELFDQKNSEYMIMEHKSEAFRKVRVHSTLTIIPVILRFSQRFRCYGRLYSRIVLGESLLILWFFCLVSKLLVRQCSRLLIL